MNINKSIPPITIAFFISEPATKTTCVFIITEVWPRQFYSNEMNFLTAIYNDRYKKELAVLYQTKFTPPIICSNYYRQANVLEASVQKQIDLEIVFPLCRSSFTRNERSGKDLAVFNTLEELFFFLMLVRVAGPYTFLFSIADRWCSTLIFSYYESLALLNNSINIIVNIILNIIVNIIVFF